MLAKRFFDLSLSVILLIALSPAMILTACLIRWKIGSPVLFRQTRPGLNGEPFTLYKFRTMTDERDANNPHVSVKAISNVRMKGQATATETGRQARPEAQPAKRAECR
ncbi:sugar transferase [Bacillus paralicheniformis]|uniref:sugar transferase n=1 Tax=Bacillus paralicheniformis TaxID=1648923 RepID=UPI001D178602|nr:sugar transferase [Bacillus paralicheniformis]MCR3887685.1 sugar transferase [Bacillus paralicheniformis]MCV9369220.1 sugar transferase [Bacillus paralicheniformis]WIG07671.1 sugar transferase [Bacillus paralicheniformis]